ncbi:MAG: ribosome silencing factor [Planctomycetes bacterium]|nr:ribosome silencing factor [Planctomycetota bacterium]
MSIRLAEGQVSGSRSSLKVALAAARTAAENRGRDIVVLDLRKLTAMCDYFVLVTGSSRRQLHAISEEIDRVLETELGDHRMGLEGYQESRWILLDYGDVVIHIFDDETRAYYDLEQLWSGAQRVDVSSELGPRSVELGTV